MKTISHRGGVAVFRIPASWKEEYSDMDGAIFYEDRPGSGTFRIKVITAKSPDEAKCHSAMEILDTIGFVRGTGVSLPDGNAIARHQQSSLEAGQQVKTFYWIIANPVPPIHARIVTFSYAIIERQELSPLVVQEIEMLEKEILQAEFASVAGP